MNLSESDRLERWRLGFLPFSYLLQNLWKCRQQFYSSRFKNNTFNVKLQKHYLFRSTTRSTTYLTDRIIFDWSFKQFSIRFQFQGFWCKSSLREKCPNTEYFLLRIFCIWTEYGGLRSKSPYSVRIQENTEQKKLRIWTIFTQCM